MPIGIILKGIGSFYYVKNGDNVIECKARGVFRKDNTIPLPGDYVEFCVVDSEKNVGRIEAILPRKTELVRPAVANVNTVIVVLSVKSPKPDLELVDKLLITSAMQGLKTVLCVNKIDLDSQDLLGLIRKNYSDKYYDVVGTSSVLNAGFEQLMDTIKGNMCVLAGASGVGKSTVLNMLRGFELMPTGKVSKKIERGRHTTRHAEIFEIEKGTFIVDTPGFSSYKMPVIDCTELQHFYPEFQKYLGKCMYNRCNHVSEPNCAVKDAVDIGEINIERYSRYATYFKNLEKFKEW